jgi:transcriptional regulator with XRE-family HTH domain
MPNTPSPTARGRRLRNELRDYREKAGLTNQDVARMLEWSPSKISRIETGQSRAQTGDVRDLLEIYGVTDPEIIDGLVTLAREAKRRGWWARYSDVFGTASYIGLEAEARTIQTYEPQNIPGLLQTEAYARALVEGGMVHPDQEKVDRRVTGRLARQELLQQEATPEIWVVLDEPVINRPVGGPKVMREQLRHLIELSTAPNSRIAIQILPLALGAHPGLHGAFVVLSFPDQKDRPVVYLESATDGLFLEEEPDIERYTLMFRHLSARALGPEQSREMIAETADRLA